MMEKSEKIEVLIEAAKARLASMTDDEKAAMWQAQRESYARSFAKDDESRRHAHFIETKSLANEYAAVLAAVDQQCICQTIKGAKFKGQATGWYYNPFMKQYGLVLTAFDPSFEGTTHVYPATQLEIISCV